MFVRCVLEGHHPTVCLFCSSVGRAGQPGLLSGLEEWLVAFTGPNMGGHRTEACRGLPGLGLCVDPHHGSDPHLLPGGWHWGTDPGGPHRLRRALRPVPLARLLLGRVAQRCLSTAAGVASNWVARTNYDLKTLKR